jgi:hypothetical protein
MSETDYFFLECLLDKDFARVLGPPELDAMARDWRKGTVLALPGEGIPVFRILPGEEGLLPPYIDEAVPVMSSELLQALRSAGVDNLQVFDVAIHELASGTVHRSHKAVNVLGLVSCVDADAPNAAALYPAVDSRRARDLPFFRLAEQPDRIVVHRRVKGRIEAQNVGARLEFREAGRDAATFRVLPADIA